MAFTKRERLLGENRHKKPTITVMFPTKSTLREYQMVSIIEVWLKSEGIVYSKISRDNRYNRPLFHVVGSTESFVLVYKD